MRLIAGAALAAVVGACALVGGIEPASALTVDFRGGGSDPWDGSITFSAAVNGNRGSFYYDNYNDDLGTYGPFTTFDTTKTGIGGVSAKISPDGYSIEINIFAKDASVINQIYGSDDPSNDKYEAYNAASNFYMLFAASTKPYVFDTVLRASVDGASLPDYSYFLYVDVTTVPLPTSAALFGFALIVLATRVYACRRLPLSVSDRSA